MARSLQRSASLTLPQPSEAEVRAHLDTLLGSDALAISERNRRFLAYIVEETLAGRGDRIKAYNVALTAFDRTDDFDPQTDPIVRIEASRLRRALEHYYLTAGKTDALRIAIPKGSYVANFTYVALDPLPLAEGVPPTPAQIETPTRHRPPLLPTRRPALWWIASLVALILVALAWILPVLIDRAVNGPASAQGTALLVLPFDTGADGDHAFVARGITAELIGRLGPREALSVLGPRAANADPTVQSDYVLSGSTNVVGSRIYISAVLLDSHTGRYLWSWNVARALAADNVLGAEAAIATEIVDSISPLIQPAR